MNVSKLDTIGDYSKVEERQRKLEKFRKTTHPFTTYIVDQNWRMIPVKEKHVENFSMCGMKGRKKTKEVYHVSMPKSIINAAKFRIVESNQNPYNSFR